MATSVDRHFDRLRLSEAQHGRLNHGVKRLVNSAAVRSPLVTIILNWTTWACALSDAPSAWAAQSPPPRSRPGGPLGEEGSRTPHPDHYSSRLRPSVRRDLAILAGKQLHAKWSRAGVSQHGPPTGMRITGWPRQPVRGYPPLGRRSQTDRLQRLVSVHPLPRSPRPAAPRPPGLPRSKRPPTVPVLRQPIRRHRQR